MKKKTGKIIAVLLLAVVLTSAVLMYCGGFGTGPCADTAEFEKYAKPVEEISVPEGTRIVALGEATHGNKEFQQLKLDVFKILVSNYGVRAFALEGDYGGCEYVNRYIHGAEGTADEAVAEVGFNIYKTDEMASLVEWMREYNETAEPGQDIFFYGFDMQRYMHSFMFLLEAVNKLGLDSSSLEKLWDYGSNGFSSVYDSDARIQVFEDLEKKLSGMDEALSEQASHLCIMLIQNIELGKNISSGSSGNALRDQFMADNVNWIIKAEEERGNKCIFVSAHNGHIEKAGYYGTGMPVMGTILAGEYDNAYFAIGTDFYKTTCNLPKSDGSRIKHTFFSYDSLAKAAKKCGKGICWLDFSTVPESSALYSAISEYHWMGSIGESYSILMNFLPFTYRVMRYPNQVFDGIIIVSNAHPTKIA